MNRITISNVIDYYDGILLFIGVDSEGNNYICMLVLDDNTNEERYLTVKVTNSVLQSLVNGTTTLLDVFKNPIDGEYFWVDASNEELSAPLTKVGKDFKLTKAMLPKANYKFSMSQY